MRDSRPTCSRFRARCSRPAIRRKAARPVSGVEIPSYADTETTFPELQARIAKTVAFLQSLGPELIDGTEDRPIVLKLRGKEVNFSGQNYLLNFALPNFFFHAVTAYDILRHNGVEIGKQDFLGNY